MSFQAPFSITEFARMKMLADQQKYDQQMAAVGSITDALAQVGGMALEMDQKRQEDEAAYGMLQALGEMFPGFGKSVKALDQLPQDVRYSAARQMAGNIGAISQLSIAGLNSGVRQQQMGVQMMMPRVRAAATAAGNAAAGQATVRPMTMPGVDLNFVD